MKDGTPEGLTDFMALGACAGTARQCGQSAGLGGPGLKDGPLTDFMALCTPVPVKAQDSRWAWAGVKDGTPEGLTDFMAR